MCIRDRFQYLNFSIAGTKLAWKAKQFDRMVKEQAKAKAQLKDKVQALPPAVTKTSRSSDGGVQTKQARQEWRKGGGQLHDPNFSALLRARGIIK